MAAFFHPRLPQQCSVQPVVSDARDPSDLRMKMSPQISCSSSAVLSRGRRLMGTLFDTSDEQVGLHPSLQRSQ